MPDEKIPHVSISQQITEFEQQHPKAAKAMQLFGVTMTKYQEALHSLHNPKFYLSNTTAKRDEKQSDS